MCWNTKHEEDKSGVKICKCPLPTTRSLKKVSRKVGLQAERKKATPSYQTAHFETGLNELGKS